MKSTHIFTGNANKELAGRIAGILKTPIGDATVSTFSDGEIQCEIGVNVRGHTAFVIQPTCQPTNDHLMELLIMIDALRRSAVKEIIAIIPYFGYARQDRRPEYSRTPITSRLVAGMLEEAGVDQVVTVDIHSTQQQGFFTKPMINISASPEIISDVWKVNGRRNQRLVVVSPDVGGVARARYIAKRLNNADLAIVDKRRERANESKVMNIIGDVEGAHCVMIDDMIDTAGTLCGAGKALKENGAASVSAYGTHAVLSGPAYENILASDLDEVVVTDTIPLSDSLIAYECQKEEKLRQISVATLIAETMSRIRSKQSISEIYEIGRK
jgi:ribose-phosphate pyrophosphokinase